jgi:uncharacterized protein (DUF58 family)
MLKTTIPDHIFDKIRRMRITTNRLVTEIFAGEYKSVFKGRGMEFLEVREYQVGDDLRTIDWNVTAREGKPYVKKYVEERELTVMFLIDISRSNYFASVNRLKRELAAEVCAVLATSAVKNNDKVGLIMFSDRIEKYIPPRKGSRHIMRAIREMYYLKPEGRKTDIPLALEYLQKTTWRSTITFLVSDFYAGGLKKPLSIAGKRHDFVALKITDPRDRELPAAGMVFLEDPENGKSFLVDTSKKAVREEYSALARERETARKNLFYSTGIDSIDIDTSGDYTKALIEFFSTRKTRRARGA